MESPDVCAAPLLVVELPERSTRRRLAKDAWEESKKLWDVVGPAVFMRMVLYRLGIVSQSFVGHLGDRDLAAFSIAYTVIDGLNFGFMFGMSSALETLCGQAYGAKHYSTMGVHLQRSWLVLLAFAALLAPTYIFSGKLLAAAGQSAELARAAGLASAYLVPLVFMYALLLPVVTFLQCQLKSWVTAAAAAAVFPVHVAATWLLVQRAGLGVLGAAMALNPRGRSTRGCSSPTPSAVAARRRGQGSRRRRSRSRTSRSLLSCRHRRVSWCGTFAVCYLIEHCISRSPSITV
ncbi:hypothetical protein HU200_055331 [Digitaria exilis]|uniref:Protein DETOXIFICATION n=1 Tax=Digitaria exilis TaxID=1010633 RepID=A0A835AJB8_9POAL|nr:hypothetical protein HU200_055331 [Digitaria exilis]